MPIPPMNSETTSSHRQSLGMWDVVSLMIGIVVGVSIFKVPGTVFQLAGSSSAGMLLWGIGAVLAFTGALSYAELAAAYPRFGAEYVFLGRAYGNRLAFLFGWMQTCAILPGSIGAMAFVFATYAAVVWPPFAAHPGIVAASAIACLAALQLIGFQVGRIAQNILSGIKVFSLTAVLLCGLCLTPEAAPAQPISTPVTSANWGDLGLALVFVLYAYGGWNDVAAVTPEVRDCRRNVPRALLMGLSLTALLYLLLNYSFWRGLGYYGLSQSEAPAADIVHRALGPRFSQIMSLVVMCSALGAIHGTMFSGCRLLAAVGGDFPWFSRWNRWNARHVPVWSLMTICLVSLGMTAIVGTVSGRQRIDAALLSMKLDPPAWDNYGGGFEVLVTASAPVFWLFFFLSGISLIVLRWKEPGHVRPFRVPGYPVTPLIFAASAAYMLWSSVRYAGRITLLLLPVMVAGLLLAALQRATAGESGPGNAGDQV